MAIHTTHHKKNTMEGVGVKDKAKANILINHLPTITTVLIIGTICQSTVHNSLHHTAVGLEAHAPLRFPLMDLRQSLDLRLLSLLIMGHPYPVMPLRFLRT